MSNLLDKVRPQLAHLPEEMRQRIELDRIALGAGVLREAAPYLAERGFRRVVLAADVHTYQVAGKTVEQQLEAAGVQVHLTRITPNAIGDVVADEASIVQLLLDIQQQQAEVVVAVGSGTLHDIARYSAYTAGIPFISIPTAPSVDGFNSKGAPLLIRGDKITIAAIGPDAIFADLDILSQAPPALVAAGFGDMLGKYTSLFDWKFGATVAGEPYLEASAQMTQSALQACVDQASLIARRDEAGIAVLTGALIESGLAMLLFGQSHPASGGEHHVSHYWEMACIREGRKQLLHGAKVGVACMEISKLYHRLAEEGLAAWPQQAEHAAALNAHWPALREQIQQVPPAEVLGDLLRTVGGPSSTLELSISEELLARSLLEAHHIRPNRFTLLRAYNERNHAHS